MRNEEYAPLRLPANLDRRAATTQLTVQAEFAGWEVSRVQLYPDGTRQVTLRRPRTTRPLPGPSY